MRPLRALGIYIAFVFLCGALLAPWLHSWRKVYAWLMGTGKMIDGWFALVVLALALAAFTRPPAIWKTDAVT